MASLDQVQALRQRRTQREFSDNAMNSSFANDEDFDTEWHRIRREEGLDGAGRTLKSHIS